MSIHLMSLVWEIQFQTPTQKLIMLRLADYADDDGNSVFPAIAEISRQVGTKERATQYAVRGLESARLLECTHRGGGGKGDVNRWRLNVDLVARLALGEMILTGEYNQLEAVENKGANIAPRTLLRVQSRLLRVQSTTDKGATGCTRTTNNHQLEPSCASADARDGSRIPPAVENLRRFELTPDFDRPQWNAWIQLMREADEIGLIRSAEVAGKMTVISKWPDRESGLQGLIEPKAKEAALSETSKRMTGEAIE